MLSLTINKTFKVLEYDEALVSNLFHWFVPWSYFLPLNTAVEKYPLFYLLRHAHAHIWRYLYKFSNGHIVARYNNITITIIVILRCVLLLGCVHKVKWWSINGIHRKATSFNKCGNAQQHMTHLETISWNIQCLSITCLPKKLSETRKQTIRICDQGLYLSVITYVNTCFNVIAVII